MRGFTPPLVLIVNDDARQIRPLADWLRAANFRVIETLDSSAVLDLARESLPELVVSDICMAEVDGWALCRQFRRSEVPQLRDMPILLVSNVMGSSLAARSALRLGASDFLSLPTTEQILIARVRALLALPEVIKPRVRNLWWGETGSEFEGWAKSVPNIVPSTDRGVVQKALEDYGPELLVARASREASTVFSILEEWADRFPGTAFVLIAEGEEIPVLEIGKITRLRIPVEPSLLSGVCHLLRRERALTQVYEVMEQNSVALRASEQRLNGIIQSTNQAFFLLDLDGKILTFNRAAQGMISRVTSGEVREGVYFAEFTHAGNRVLALLQFARAKRGKRSITDVNFDHVVGDKDCVYRVTSAPVFNEDGSVGAVCINAQDISHRRTMQRAQNTAVVEMERSRAQLQALFDHSLDGIILADNDGALVDLNPAAWRLFGYTKEEMLALRWQDLSVPAEPGNKQAHWLAFLKEGSAEGEMILRGKADETIHVEFSAIANIQPGLHLSIIRDVTERRQLQDHLLRQQRMESLGRLASGVAHDLNNILTPILMVPSMLRSRVKDPLSLNMLTALEKGARRGAGIVRKLLTFAQGLPFDRKRLDLNQPLQGALIILRETFPASIVIDVEVAEPRPDVIGDLIQLEQMILNLAINAGDAMSGGGRLSLQILARPLSDDERRVHADAPDGMYLVFTVGDNGHGIAPEHIDKIFDPFYSTKAFGEGSGLGLSTVLGIAQNHQGFVTVDSQVGVGSVFRVYIPGATKVENVIAPARLSPREGQGMVMVVDDEENMRLTTRQLLIDHGYQVVTANDGESALRQLDALRAKVDVVVTDIMMPGMGGYRLIDALRRKRPELRIIAMTGGQKRSSESRSVGARLLLKPFSADELIAAIETSE